ncbi:hypothetical protein ACWOFR_06105 [Carnobacterium gallinarum]|uniref:hypothetical protein n=1 Tax=Carnobacterium gallinarum TaxID=2749 RepID=UPI000557FDB1|nr:hypothetical protein [Carnobacterium gallinarum]
MKYWYTRLLSVKYLLGFFLGVAIVSSHIVFEMVPRIRYLDGVDVINLPSTTWLGGDINGGIPSIYYLLLPLFSVLGANLIVFEDKKNSYFLRFIQKQSIFRYSMRTFGLSFISGFLISFISLAIDFIVAFSLFPNINPDIILNSNLSVTSKSTYFSDLFFTNPYLLIFMYMIMAGCMSGLYSCTSATISLYVKNIYIALSTVFLITVILTTLSYVVPKIIYSPASILQELGGGYLPPFSSIVSVYFIVLVTSFYYFIRGVNKNAVI